MSTESLTDRLHRIRDQLRVRGHLAALEARSAWDRANLESVGEELARARDEARVQAHLGAMEARDAWGRVDRELATMAGKTGRAGDEAVATLAHAIDEILGRAPRAASGAS